MRKPKIVICKHLNKDDASCSLGINGGYCSPIWHDEDCERMKKPNPFDKSVQAINNILASAHSICKQEFQERCVKCTLRKEPEDPDHGDVVQCRYPERINCVNVDNCTYKWCPLIKR